MSKINDLKQKIESETATWEMVKDPMYMVDCPHCKKTIIMSSPSVIERLKRWGIQKLK